MKYDFTRCNNLIFKVKKEGVEKTGYLKISSEGKVDMFYSDGEKIFDPAVQIEVPVSGIHFLDIGDFSRWAERHELEIIPRDPEVYTDWKVGDKVANIKHGDVYTIIALFGSAAVLTMDAEDYTVLTTTDALTKYDKLIPTDYEKELLNAQDEKKDVCPFRKGDRVLVRDEDEDAWIFETFDSYEGGNEYPYDCKEDVHKQCIPYNEKTWKLLGTADEYKEEE